MPDSPLVYVFLGRSGSERRALIADLIEGGIDADASVLYFRPETEAASLMDDSIAAMPNVQVIDWALQDAKLTHGKVNAAPEKIIFLAPGNSDPADVVEAVKTWSEHNHCCVARLITAVDCAFLKSKPEAQSWYDACIHFSDIVLLARREGVDNKWLKSFEDRYAKNHYPCRFLLVKKGRVQNPAEILEPEARRMSLYFDELIAIEEDEFEEERPEDQKPDKYIERLASGQRAYPIPDINKLL
jgi:hypothetical protein